MRSPGVRLATFNILSGRGWHDGQVDLDRFGRAIAGLDADVLGLQEVDCSQPRSHGADLTALAAAAMDASAYRFVPALWGTPGLRWRAASDRDGGNRPGAPAYGIALLSRHPVRTWRTVRLPRLPARVPLYVPERGRWLLLREEPRVAIIATVETPIGPLTVANTHLSFVPAWNRVQLRRLARELRIEAEPVVLLGDLNRTSPVPLPGFRPLAMTSTFPADRPARQLDHVLARGALPEVAAVGTPPVDVSDHRPVLVDLVH